MPGWRCGWLLRLRLWLGWLWGRLGLGGWRLLLRWLWLLLSECLWGGSSPGGDIAPVGCVGHPEV
ncbi:hypothetical protein DMP23_03495 [Amycolatopsis sp. A1MSW2902]